MAIFLSVASSLVVGAFLLVAPWTRLWDGNLLLQPAPAVRDLALHAATRGLVSGLGLVNILLAVNDAREHLSRRRRAR